jgi:hypothetical protein
LNNLFPENPLKAASDSDDKRRDEQNDQFKKIASELKSANDKDQERFELTVKNSQQQFEATLQNSQLQFEATRKASESIMGKTSQAAVAAQDASRMITGGNSWGYTSYFHRTQLIR